MISWTSINILLNKNPAHGKSISTKTQVWPHPNRINSKLPNDLVGLLTYAVEMVDVFVVHEEEDSLSFQDTNTKLIDLRYHWNQKSIKWLIHETFNIAKFFITFFFDVVFHLVGNQSIRYLVTYVLQQHNIIRGEILWLSFISYLHATDGIVT